MTAYDFSILLLRVVLGLTMAAHGYNKFFGGGLRQAVLAVAASSLLAGGLVVLATTGPWLPGVAGFAILFGLGSGLTSIVS